MSSQTFPQLKNPPGRTIDLDLLERFERNLDPRSPESNEITCRILGFGEISTVFEVSAGGMDGLAMKRMSIFKSPRELERYIEIYLEYNRLLKDEITLHTPAHGYAAWINDRGRPILYIIQEMLPPDSIGHQAVSRLPRNESIALFTHILRQMAKVWEFNASSKAAKVAIDGQISNWAVDGFDPRHFEPTKPVRLLYFDTSTPLFQVEDTDQLDPELFLRSAPPFLAWILRLLFVEEVMTRYYDPRRVVVDLIANLYKENLPDLVAPFINTANQFFLTAAWSTGMKPIRPEEVRAYHRSDARIWWLYLRMRRFDRFLRRSILRREYPYILPP